MTKKEVLFKSDERKDRKDVAKFLRKLADRVENGKVVLRRGDDEVKLKLPASVNLEIEAETKPKKRRTKRSLEIEIEWYEGESGETVTLE